MFLFTFLKLTISNPLDGMVLRPFKDISTNHALVFKPKKAFLDSKENVGNLLDFNNEKKEDKDKKENDKRYYLTHKRSNGYFYFGYYISNIFNSSKQKFKIQLSQSGVMVENKKRNVYKILTKDDKCVSYNKEEISFKAKACIGGTDRDIYFLDTKDDTDENSEPKDIPNDDKTKETFKQMRNRLYFIKDMSIGPDVYNDQHKAEYEEAKDWPYVRNHHSKYFSPYDHQLD